MEIISEKIEEGIVERRFDLRVDDEVVPGIHWLPEKPASTHPTVLIGHGGTQHKRVANVLGLAQKFVSERGYGVVALDAPGHGERMTEEERAAQRAYRAQRNRGDRPPRDQAQSEAQSEARRDQPQTTSAAAGRRRSLTGAAPKAVKEWKALLDDLQTNDAWKAGPFGYWGVSMGTGFGIPLLADEPRINAAVLGLSGSRGASGSLAEKITIPLLFLFQWDDTLMTRESGVALWQSFGSTEKTMHINPGPHVGIPLFERDAATRFFARHLES